MIDDSGAVAKLLEYPLAIASSQAAERFNSMLFAAGGDDVYGVVLAVVVGQERRSW
jgi:hypothetical protein